MFEKSLRRVLPARNITRRRTLRVVSIACGLTATSLLAYSFVTNLALVERLHDPAAEHADQTAMLRLLASGQDQQAFEMAFEHGDELFETKFNALDGVGANVGLGQRFTRVPRADLSGPGEWANHVPARATGPNAASCTGCHNQGADDGSGGAETNAHRDPLHTGNLRAFIQRNTPHVFALGGLQRCAEEMTQKLFDLRQQAINSCCASGQSVTVQLVAKGISFGSLKVTRTGTNPCTTVVDTSNVAGISTDLVVRPFQWKGSIASIRDFNRDAAHNELGMQAVELVGQGIDGDGDGVVNELSVGDQTALAVYLAAQPRPTSKFELTQHHLLEPPLNAGQMTAVARGVQQFASVGCANCHVPVLRLDQWVFSEPSQNANYRDTVFPSGANPLALGVDPARAVRFDLTKDQPDNQILDGSGHLSYHLGALRKDGQGKAMVELYGDMKRHEMGHGLAENIDETGSGASVWLTRNLWGVGSTAPYMHDGRATTLTEAILEHGGEALQARNAFTALSTSKQKDLIAFLDNLVLYKMPAE